MSLCFLHAADLHLDSPMRGLARYEGAPVDEVRGATRRAFDRLVELALGGDGGRRVDFVVLSGDLYDGDWNDYNTGLYFTAGVARLAEEGVPVIIKRGNHDAASRMTRALRLPAGVTLLRDSSPQTVVLDQCGVALHGQSFATGVVDVDLTPGYPAPLAGLFNVGVLHTSLNGRAGHDPYAPTDVDTLRRKGYDYWALGHVHAAEIVCRDPWVVYPGNTQGRHVREAGERGCALITVADGAIDHRFVALDGVRWSTLTLQIDGLVDLEQLFEQAHRQIGAQTRAAGGRTLALRVLVQGRGPLHGRISARPQSFEAEVRSLAIAASAGKAWIEKVVVESRSLVDAAALVERDDPLGLLVRELHALQSDEDGLRQLAREAMADLAGRLPPDVAGLAQDDPAVLRELLAGVEGELLDRLAGDEPATGQ